MTPVHAATPYCMTCRHNSTPLPRCTWSVTRYGPLGRNASHPSPSGGEYEAAVHSHQQAAAMSAAAGHRRGHGHSLIRLGDAIVQLASTPRRASPGRRHLSCSATSAPRRRSDQGRASNRPAGFQRRVDLIGAMASCRRTPVAKEVALEAGGGNLHRRCRFSSLTAFSQVWLQQCCMRAANVRHAGWNAWKLDSHGSQFYLAIPW
jgi:hypothetical protein